MSTMAMASSSLNPDAPLFIPAAYRRVEDFSAEWWDLVQTTAWFRDHWFRQHQLLEEAEAEHDADDIAALLPDDAFDLLATDDLFYAPDNHHHQKPAAAYPFPAEADAAVLRTLSLNSPRALGAHAEKPSAHHVGVEGGAHRAAIHQPR